MKAIYLAASAILTVLILILAFENIGATCTYLNFLFFPIDHSPTIIILGVSVLGIFTGISYHAFLSRYLASTASEEDEQF